MNAKEVNPGNPTKQDDCDDAVVGVDEPVVPTPVYSCDALNLTAGANRTVTAKVMYTAKNGASFETATFHWGDGSASDPSAQTSADHVYAADGSYTVTAKLVFDVNGEKKTVGGDNCVKTVNFVAPEEPVVPTPEETEPQVLPDTGAGSIIGLSGVIGVLSALGYRLFLGRKLARD
ncbi:hypothetical protein CSA80_04885 [Candidatus Saccharibacteria bacterium]|nr:MAG: hypothetical protein CSA80_04885 [Candidatus Saccharibacteria bacterium]